MTSHHRAAAIVASLFSSACCRTSVVIAPASAAGAGLEIAGELDCRGDPVPWTDAARADAKEIIERSLVMPAMINDLAIGDEDPQGLLVYLILPDGIEVPRLPFVREAMDVSTTNNGTADVWFWKIEILERHRGGAILTREQTVVSPGGRTAYAISVVCVALHDGVPMLQWYGGFAN